MIVRLAWILVSLPTPIPERNCWLTAVLIMLEDVMSNVGNIGTTPN